MDYLVLPCVKMETSANDALEVMRAAGRSALLVRDEQEVFWFLDLGHLLSEIREGKNALSSMAPGQGVIVATEGGVAMRPHEARRRRALSSRIQQIINTANVPFVVIPGLSLGSSEFGSVPTTRLPLKTGRVNPVGVRNAELAQTEMGVFTKTFLEIPSEVAPPSDFTLVATRHKRTTELYLTTPRWCTCSEDSSHKYEYNKHQCNKPCPMGDDGKLECP